MWVDVVWVGAEVAWGCPGVRKPGVREVLPLVREDLFRAWGYGVLITGVLCVENMGSECCFLVS